MMLLTFVRTVLFGLVLILIGLALEPTPPRIVARKCRKCGLVYRRPDENPADSTVCPACGTFHRREP